MKYLNGVLTVIAVCLVLLTFVVTGIIPSANAGSPGSKSVTIPLNPDGTLTVRLAPGEVQDVNIKEVGGSSTYSGKIDVNVKEVGGSSSGRINVNIDEVDGNTIYRAIPVKMTN